MKISNDEILVAYLRSGFNLSETAKALGVCRQTIAKRVQTPEFQKQLTEYRNTLFRSSSQELLEATTKASKTLVKLLDSSNENVRLQSAVKILNLSADYTTIDDLEQELNSLREIINKE
uniref:helix-turn-helix domain-containing protein n=1 Tax=Ruminococcus bromii TaxID=40518 RepID=UPI003FF03508